MKKIILLLTAFFCLTNSYAQTINNPKLRDSLKILLQKEKRDTSRVRLLTELSYEYAGNKPDTAMILALEALGLSKRIGFVKGEALGLNRIGLAYSLLGNQPKALEARLQALKLNEKINNLAGITRNLSGIGAIYSSQEDYHKAIEYFLKSNKLCEQLNDKQGLTVNLGNISNSYRGLKQYDSAKVYAQKANEVASKFNVVNRIGRTYNLIGDIYSETGQNKLALEYYRLSIPYSAKAENDLDLRGPALQMAKVFEKTGQSDSAFLYAKQAWKTAKKNGVIAPILDVSNFLSYLYKKTGNIDSAFFYLEIAKSTSDSLNSKGKTNQLQSLFFDEKLRQNEIEEDRKHNLQFAALAIGLITFIILFFVLSRSIIVKTKFIEFFGILGLLAVFEFINLFIHPYLAHATNDSPVLMLIVLIVIGAMLVPLHHKLEKWITKIMVEKNKKIRLEAARKTIENLEPAFADAAAGKTEQTI